MWRHITPKNVRDTTLFVAGLLGVGNEALLQQEVSEFLLLLYAAMMGLPGYLRWDEGKHE